MRKITITFLLAAAMMLGITGCGMKQTRSNATTSVEQGRRAVYKTGLNKDGTLSDLKYSKYIKKLCNYKKIRLDKETVEPTDSTVDSRIESIRNSFITQKEITGEAKEGDYVNIDFKGTVKGKEFDGGTSTGYNLELGSGSFIDGFEDQLVGHKAGDKVTVRVTFPDDYSEEELAGENAKFEVTINKVYENVIPELTDEWVRDNLEDIYGYNSVKDMKQRIKESLEENNKENAVWDYLLAQTKFKKIPEDAVKERSDVYFNSLGFNIADDDDPESKILESLGYKTMDEFYEARYENSNEELKKDLIADAIADKEGIKVTEDDVEEYLSTDDASQYINGYSQNYIYRNVLNWLVARECAESAALK